MNEFAKMIYEKWAEDHAESALYFDTGCSATVVKRSSRTHSGRASSTRANACLTAKLSSANNNTRRIHSGGTTRKKERL